MLIHQDRLKYRARRLGVIPYISDNMSGLLKNHQYYYHCGTKSNLVLGPNRIWALDQIEFGQYTGDELRREPQTRRFLKHTQVVPKYAQGTLSCVLSDQYYDLTSGKRLPLCGFHYITTSNDWLHKNITTMRDVTT